MTTEQFVYWLQGFLEISNARELSEEQVQVIRDHLTLVLTKETPSRWQPSTQSPLPLIGPFDPPSPLPNLPICETGTLFCKSLHDKNETTGLD